MEIKTGDVGHRVVLGESGVAVPIDDCRLMGMETVVGHEDGCVAPLPGHPKIPYDFIAYGLNSTTYVSSWRFKLLVVRPDSNIW